MKKWLGLFVFGLLVVSLIGLVSGLEPNICLNPGVSVSVTRDFNDVWDAGIPRNVIDGSSSTSWGFWGEDEGPITRGTATIIIDFPDVFDVSKMSITSSGYSCPYPDYANYERIYLESNGGWVPVDSRDAAHWKSTMSKDGSWPNVTRAKVVSSLGVDDDCFGFWSGSPNVIDQVVNYKIYEVYVYGMPPGSSVPVGCPSDILSYWKLDEEEGTIVDDFIGSVDGNLEGYGSDVYKGVPGQVDGALRFDGIEDYVNTNRDYSWSSSESFSIGFWINPVSIDGPQGVLGKYDAEWSFRLDDDVLEFVYWSSTGDHIYLSSVGSKVALGKWDYFVATYSPGKGGILYKNGDVVVIDTSGSSFWDRVSSVSMGRSYYDNSVGRYFEGMLDEVAIYDRELLASEVLGQYEKGVIGLDICQYFKKCSSDDQVIMKLAYPVDSLGALWDDGDYTWDICYDEIFDVDGDGDRVCAGNKVVGLAADGGALAQEPSLDSYPVDVCYGDLGCTVRSNECEPGEEIVVALYQDDESLLMDPNAANYIPDSVVSWWDLDEEEGYVVSDSIVSSGNDGTVYGNTKLLMHLDGNLDDESVYANGAMNAFATWLTSGCKLGSCLSFDEFINDYVRIGDNEEFDDFNAAFSVSAWARPTAYPGSSNTIIGQESGFLLAIDSAGFLNNWIYAGGSWLEDISANVAVPLDTWTYFTLTYDGSKIKSYINGDLQGSGTAKIGHMGTDSLVYLGARDPTGNFQPFTGMIDELGVYSKVLSADEIEERFNAGRAKFADFVDGKFGGALSFDGVDDYVSVGDLGLVFEEGSLSFWTKFSSSSDSGFVNTGYGTGETEYFGVVNAGGRIRADFDDGDTGGCALRMLASSGTYNDNQWHHVVATFVAQDVGRLYIDGKEEGVGVSLVGCDAEYISNNFVIGAYYNPTGNSYYLDGLIDEVTVYSEALSPLEVRKLYETFGGIGDRRICCGPGEAVPPLSNLEWRDMSGNEIGGTTGISADVGDTVQMVKMNSLSGTFEVWDHDLVSDDEIRVGVNAIPGVVDGSDIKGLWTITEEDKDLAYEVFENYEQFEFRIGGDVSGYLAVVGGDDDPMNITINSPMCAQVFDEGDVVMIGVGAVDSDDLITGSVTIGSTVVPFDNGGVVFDYAFDVPGNHQVIVEATNTRGERSRTIASLMILEREGEDYIDGVYVAACIKRPEDFSDVFSSIVEFDASNTRGIRVVDGEPIYILPGNESLNFYWSFFPDGNVYGGEYVGTGNPKAYSFITQFAIAGDNSATLKVELI